jgi:hypothetical protein
MPNIEGYPEADYSDLFDFYEQNGGLVDDGTRYDFIPTSEVGMDAYYDLMPDFLLRRGYDRDSFRGLSESVLEDMLIRAQFAESIPDKLPSQLS